MRLAQEGLGEVVMIDVLKGLACGKALDLEDARAVLKHDYSVCGSEDIGSVKDSDIVIVTAGLARRPGMTREDLLNKNAQILKDICSEIGKTASKSLVIVVTNPLDLMTRLALKYTGFTRQRVFGMGVTLDAARFANLISQELSVPSIDIEATVIGAHGEGMLPLARFTNIRGVALEEFLDEKRIGRLINDTIGRGAAIVSLLGSGSAFFAPSAAITALVRAIVKDEKRTLGVSAYLEGEYGIRDVCIGIPCRLGREGIEEIVELPLNKQEKDALIRSAAQLKEQLSAVKL